MAKRATQAAQDKSEPVSNEQTTDVEVQKSDENLNSAREKLARMESTQRLCFRHQNDLKKLEAELRALGCYKDYEITQILEPKGNRNLPGFLNREIDRWKQFVDILSASATTITEGHAARIDRERARADEMARG